MEVKKYLRMITKLNKSKQKSQYDLILKDGQKFKFNKNSFKGPHGPPKNCFTNAGKLARDNPDLTYVEGYIIFHGVPIEHAWCVNSKKQVIDPTLTSGTGISEYFGVPISTSFLIMATLKTGHWGVFNWQQFSKLNFTGFRPAKLTKKKTK